VTAGPVAHSIGNVPDRIPGSATTGAVRRLPRAAHSGRRPVDVSTGRAVDLTKRRAVDFCRVATALCRVAYGRSQPVTPQSSGAAI